ncbi:MAG: YceI family protein [Bacteroidota bacterium]
MRIANAFILMIAFLSFAFTGIEGDRVSATVDTETSQVLWKGYKVTGEHAGTIMIKEGNLDFEGDALIGGSFLIDMTTIACTDLEGEWKEKLEGHLKSDDFFGVNNFPNAKFEITKVAAKGTPGDYKITGNLTIKETTKEIKFYANVSQDGGKNVAKADIKIDRSEFNVRYGSGSFFDNLGDKTIYDEFDLTIVLHTK